MKGVLSKVIRLVFAVLLIINTIPRNLYAEEPETVPVQESVDVPVEESVETPAEEVVVETVTEAEPNAPPQVEEAPAQPIETKQVEEEAPVQEKTETVTETVEETEVETVTEPVEVKKIEEEKTESPAEEEIVFEIFFETDDNGYILLDKKDANKENKVKQEIKSADEIISVIAEAKEGYEFVEWQLNGIPFSTNIKLDAKEIKFNNQDRYKAIFKEIEKQTETEETIEPEIKEENEEEKAIQIFFEVEGNGLIALNAEGFEAADQIIQEVIKSDELLSVVAQEADGFEFVAWKFNDEIISEEKELKAEIIDFNDQNKYFAEFKEIDAQELPIEELKPAQEFTGYAGKVFVYASVGVGVLPAGTTMSVTEVPQDSIYDAVNDAVEGNVKNIYAVDITFWANGEEIQPDGPVNVVMRTVGSEEGSGQNVVHIDHNDNVEVVDANITSNAVATKTEFTAEQFSIYAIVESGETVTYRRKYIFQDINSEKEYSDYKFYNKNGELVNTQIAKNGDALEEIGTPYHSGYDFDGWYIWDEVNGFTTKVEFGTALVLSSLTADEEVTVRAKYGNVYYVHYHELPETAEDDVILTTKVVADGQSEEIASVIAPLPGPGLIFTGWALKGTTEQLKNPYTPVSDCDLYPLFAKGYWLRFIGNGVGASYTEAISVFEDQDLSEVTKPADPTRPGYSFAGWFTAADGEEKFVWEGTINSDTPVYAHWIPKTDVQYTVIYWLENANDADYTYLTSKKLTGIAGEATNAQELTNTEKNRFPNINWNGFILDEIEQGIINGDGSTTVNVYYHRKIVTLTFHSSTETRYVEDPNGDYYKVTRLVNDNQQHYWYYKTSDNGYQQINTGIYYKYKNEGPLANSENVDSHVLLYRRISSIFGDYYVQANTRYDWGRPVGREIYGTVTRYRISSGAQDITITAKYGSDIYEQWAENPSGGTDWYLSPTSSTFVTLVTTMPVDDTDYYYKEQYGNNILVTRYMIQNLSGNNQFSEYAAASSKGNTGIYTTADDYTGIEGFSINAYSNSDAATIRRTNGGDPNATYNNSFYRSPEIGTEFSSGERSGNRYTLTFYYLRNKYDINFISNGSTVLSEKEIYYGADISNKVPSDYVIDKTEAVIAGENVVFKGWFDNEDCEGQPYQFKTMPAGNVTLYAKWEKAWYIVTIDPNGGSLNGNDPSIHHDSTWFWIEYGDLISEYNTERNFVEDADGDYYYHISRTESDRLAYYTKDASSATDTSKKYRYEEKAYTFLGWHEVNEDGSVSPSEYDFQSGVKKNITLQAQWIRSGSYTVAYQGHVSIDGETIGGNVSSPTESYADGAEIVASVSPTGITPSYVFDGWEIVDANGKTLDDNDGKYYQQGDKIALHAEHADKAKVVHIQAHYTKAEESEQTVSVTKIIFDANSGKTKGTFADLTDENGYTVVPVSDDKKATYDKIPINQKFDLNSIKDNFEREGYTLEGWATNSTATEPEYGLEDSVGADNLDPKINTLYAVWTEIEYEVIFDKNNEKAEGSMENQVFKFNEEKALTTNAYTLEGHTFVGWKDKDNNAYTDKQIVKNLATEKGEKITLYAQWQPIKYKVTFVDEDGTVLKEATEYDYGTKAASIVKPDDPTKDPTAEHTYTFAGWTPEIADVTKDATYKATYEKTVRTYTVTWKNEDGTVLETDKDVAYGTTPKYDGATPTKAADAQYTYTFDKWTPDVVTVTGDATYTASFAGHSITPPTPGPDPEPDPPTPPTPPGPPTPGPGPGPGPEPTPEPAPEPTPEPTPTPSPEPEPIPDEPVPQTDPEKYWALANLLASIGTVLTALGMILTFFRKRKDEEEEENVEAKEAAVTRTATSEEEAKEEEEDDKNKRKKSKFLGLIPAIGSVILFILTEDMRNKMIWTDKYTLAMVIILLVNFVLAYLTRNKKKDDDEEEDKPADPNQTVTA